MSSTRLTLLGLGTLLCSPALAAEVRPLYAGQHMEAGELRVCDDGFDLSVTYDSTATGWAFTSTHLHVGDDAPKKAAPGRFPYAHEDIFDDVDRYTLSLAELGAGHGDELIIAAHADVVGATYTEPDLGLLPEVPDLATVTPTAQGDGAYWTLEVSEGGPLDGVYDGYCVDTDRTMATGTSYTATVTSSYDDLADLVEYPENFDQVNWILNQDLLGMPSDAGGDFTYGDIQLAIWTLIEDTPSTAGLGTYSQDRVDEILFLAAEGGLGYEPGCFDQMAVLLAPVDAEVITHQVVIAQVVTITVDLECELVPTEGEETAWTSGDVEFKQGWGSYFSYEVGSSCD